MQTRYNAQNKTRVLQKAFAVEYAKQYCMQRGLSKDKLAKQRLEFVDGAAIFAQPSGVKPNGLMNDMATMPFPTLIITVDGERLKVETTEHTEKYLK